MAVTIMRQEIAPSALQALSTTDEFLTTYPLTSEHEAEVLAFLAARPIHTVFMASLIRDNGLVSPLNRGSFYACRDQAGHLEGVALIGHATVIEACHEAALAAFARLAKNCRLAHLIRGEQEEIECFWNYYADVECKPRLLCRELLLEQRTPLTGCEAVDNLRQATLADLEQVMAVNAAMALEESGINPLGRDPEGFRQRSIRRIQQGRVWVWVENNRLLFKADIIADTPEVTYLEGVYVHPQERGKGYGLRCLSQLGRTLLKRTGSLCLTVNEQVRNALAFYQKAGYELHSYYDTIYLQPRSS